MENRTLAPEKEHSGLADAIDRILDKGLVINADIVISVAGVELLGIKIRAALASFETAAKYGLEFPSGTNLETTAWKNAMIDKEDCPQCGKQVDRDELLNSACPWCGWDRFDRVHLFHFAHPPRPPFPPPFLPRCRVYED